ncbi:MAG: hypothetical protein HKP03_05520 [Xanthomonadales bacterium]|nr:hypothetical protein [Xanthomonadales bacterium]
MKLIRVKRSLGPILALLCLVGADNALAAGQTIRLADDSNSRLEIKDAVTDGDRTTVLFWTWPDRGDPNFRDECGKNYYTVTLRPGLPTAEPRLLAGGACAGISFLQGGLLEDGSGKFIIRDRLEHWRDGERISSKPLASLDHIGTLRLDSSDVGSQWVDLDPAGNLVVAVAVSGYAAQDWPGIATVMASLDSDDQKRWLITMEQANNLTPEQLWAGRDGSALLRYFTIDTTAIAADPETRLAHVSAAGERVDLPLVHIAKPYDVLSMEPGSEADLQKAFAYMEQNRSEQIESLAARPREQGGFDVLFKRKSDKADRNGYFLLRLDSDGAVQSEAALGSVIDDHGLNRWFDFYVDGRQVVLLSSAQVTQTGVNSRRKQWAQTVVSQFDIDSGEVTSRLIPLERQYLEAAMNAGDARQQYLEGQPGGTPVLLSSLAGVPLSLSQGWIRKRQTLRVFEVTDDLTAFTEFHDKQQARLARETQRQQRKAAREAGQQQMQEQMAASAGMNRQEFEALSKEEQLMHMMQSGDMEAIMATAMEQAAAAQSGMTPEQAAQMQAQMAQVQQLMQGAGMAAAAASPAAASSSEATSSFTVDTLNNGHIRFKSPAGTAVILSLMDGASEKELMNREYPDGEIDEVVALSRYRVPVDRLRAVITGANGNLLAELEPETD